VKTLAEFREFYDRELVSAIGPFERQRKKTLLRIGIAAVIMLALSATALLLLADRLGFFGVIGVLFAAHSVVAIVGGLSLRGYKRGFKDEVVRRVVEFINPKLYYRARGCVPRRQFSASHLFEYSVDRYRGEDFVSGRLGKTKVRFSEVHAGHETRNSESGSGYRPLFKGLFLTAEFNKKFKGTTVVVPDLAERAFGGWLGRLLQNRNFMRTGELVKLEDPDFEKYFAVYADDQVEARYILTPSLMRRLVEFRERPETGDRILVSFANARVNVAVPLRRNMLEPRFFRSLLDFHMIREYYLDLTLALGIVQDLDLNTRIWTKE